MLPFSRALPLMVVFALSLGLAAVGGEPVTIGADAVAPDNARSHYARYVNWRPADGQTVRLNPPRMSWPYRPDWPRNWNDALHTFTLQISSKPDSANPVVNVTCPFNFYNTLPQLKGADTWYWRVGYDVGSDDATWSPVHSFTIADDAAVWDRAALAKPDLAARGHPRVLFNKDNVDQVHEVYEKRALPHLERFVRHMLFVRGKYFVIYDDLASSKPATHTWLYHIRPEKPFTFDPKRFAVDYAVGDVKVRVQHVAQAVDLTLDDRQGMDAFVNPMTGEDYRRWRKDDILCGHNLWVSNRTPAKKWAFLAVVYPAPPATGIPAIEPLGDAGVRVGDDVICFTPGAPAAARATIVVDVAAMRPKQLNGIRVMADERHYAAGLLLPGPVMARGPIGAASDGRQVVDDIC